MRNVTAMSLALLAVATVTGASAQTPAATPAAARQPPKGEMTRAQAEARSNAMFGRMDANGDGALSPTELAAQHGKRRPQPQAAASASAATATPVTPHNPVLAAADRDGNGTVTKAEFAAATLARFDAADANKDGTVTRAERAATRASMHGAHRPKQGN